MFYGSVTLAYLATVFAMVLLLANTPYRKPGYGPFLICFIWPLVLVVVLLLSALNWFWDRTKKHGR